MRDYNSGGGRIVDLGCMGSGKDIYIAHGG